MYSPVRLRSWKTLISRKNQCQNGVKSLAPILQLPREKTKRNYNHNPLSTTNKITDCYFTKIFDKERSIHIELGGMRKKRKRL